MQHGKPGIVEFVFGLGLIAFVVLTASAQELQSPGARSDRSRLGAYHMEGVSDWFEKKFTEDEIGNYSPEDFWIQQHLCNCSDQPRPHYPYVMILFSTPKGDLVGRPERRGFDTIIVPLAERRGEHYCDLDAAEQCIGPFSDPCDFSDFRYGEQLAPYFPSCKVPDEPTLDRTSFPGS